MDGATIAAKVWMGYGMAAMRVGTPYTQYRPTNPLGPMATAYGTQYAVFDSGNYNFTGPEDYGKATWRALVDGRYTLPGDIFSGAAGNFFIAAQDPMLPIFAVRCNATITVFRPAPASMVGPGPYGGDVEASRIPIMAGWPASILAGTHTPERSVVALPGDGRMPWKAILLPMFAGVAIMTNDYITDTTGLRYQVSDAELTNLGWRISATVRES